MEKEELLLQVKEREIGIEKMRKELNKEEREGLFDGKDSPMTRRDFEISYHYLEGLRTAYGNAFKLILLEGKGGNVSKADKCFRDKIAKKIKKRKK